MIGRVTVDNWQSLRSIDLELGRFTVIVGPSSSGKTALIRALRALASNVRGGGQITRGAKAAAVTVYTDRFKVTLERSESSGLYRIVDLATGAEQVFTKLAGGVPEAVTAALGIQPAPTNGASINFAGQFDRPYLLDDSGAAVARVLGELTNVTTIFEAVREANRRRTAFAALLRTRTDDLAALRAQAAGYATLPARMAVCADAEKRAETAVQLQDQIRRLRRATDTLAVAEGVLARHQALPGVPADAGMLAAKARLDAYKTLLRTWIEGANRTAAATAAIDQAAADESALHDELHALLVAAGTCPTCQQPVEAKPEH